ncbi:dienelactone hydrolase family protein [Rhabdothermincola salaria]|uniref:dienelactone hydrolase family protein n=1 Tax=Rhabdothermincola salaria TaxID=2903142 RepID=UPI001E40407D|nr:dienelactone hydrolase family protein [Rhabdothermincola salaria]MCD9623456.1 dienelactone hydrolase family protein [Rhabdothermincola salaria]
MGELVSFPTNGHETDGYLAVPVGGSGPGVVVIQEWWGLVPHIRDVCDRFAAAGFVALAPDLYHGESTTEPDEAGKLMMALNLDQAVKDMSGAVDHLRSLDAVTSDQVGVVGFCMGGGLALALACARPDAIGAAVPYYGVIPWPNLQPDWSRIDCAILGHFAEQDAMFGPDQVRQLEERLREHGKAAELIIHPGVDHAFFNDTRPEVHDPEMSAQTWEQTTVFLRENLA